MFVQDTGYGPEKYLSDSPPVEYETTEFGELYVILDKGGQHIGAPCDEIFPECSECHRGLIGCQLADRKYASMVMNVSLADFGLSNACDYCVQDLLASDLGLQWGEYLIDVYGTYRIWGLKQQTALRRPVL